MKDILEDLNELIKTINKREKDLTEKKNRTMEEELELKDIQALGSKLSHSMGTEIFPSARRSKQTTVEGTSVTPDTQNNHLERAQQVFETIKKIKDKNDQILSNPNAFNNLNNFSESFSSQSENDSIFQQLNRKTDEAIFTQDKSPSFYSTSFPIFSTPLSPNETIESIPSFSNSEFQILEDEKNRDHRKNDSDINEKLEKGTPKSVSNHQENDGIFQQFNENLDQKINLLNKKNSAISPEIPEFLTRSASTEPKEDSHFEEQSAISLEIPEFLTRSASTEPKEDPHFEEQSAISQGIPEFLTRSASTEPKEDPHFEEQPVTKPKLPEVTENDNTSTKGVIDPALLTNPSKSIFSKINNKASTIIRTRKPKKNIRKHVIFEIATLATSLVLLAAGVKHNPNLITSAKLANPEVKTVELPQVIPDDLGYSNNDENLTKIGEADEEETNKETNNSFFEDENEQYIEYYDNQTPSENEEQSVVDFISIDNDQNQPITEMTENDEWFSNLAELTDPSQLEATDQIKIGSTVNIGTANIYSNYLDAYLEENPHTQYYKNSPQRLVLGVAIATPSGIERKYIYTPNVNQEIDQLINEGGEIVSVLTANKDKYLMDYQEGSELTREEVTAYQEGWYNIKSVSNQNMKGIKR